MYAVHDELKFKLLVSKLEEPSIHIIYDIVV